ncbi:MAG: phosphoadenylyl-sulfate reductase [Mitsuaria chitosanitabida]|jgi:thioredoxin-dependent adenylylsulfate APS reductase|uniref:phosphoadenylyl-sulfate reductase n=1 Tax=Roseateles chitosanitabidus TaxID=65048 RepID=UPI001B126EC0|nr:phosphoadenylyl-sulfate reductase [Roseateles chitosanitabidus]MBO9689783.1 phosphoadenylyl-sulfate reductase [Roseateles chitosanitabidus]
MGAIDLYARKTAGFDERLARTVEVLRQAAADFGPGALQSTSLGVEDMVITDLIARHQLPIALATLDTGKLHAQTLALIPRIEQRYGLEVEVFAPVNEQVVHFVRANGEEPMYRSVELRKACCGVRKLEPLARMLTGRTAWITGLRREQSTNRAEVPFREDDGQGRVKVNPLAEWTWADVWHYVQANDVPYNPLHDEFMPSIGCAPCTRAIAVGEDFRAGRWWWEDSSKECGLHATHGEPGATSSLDAAASPTESVSQASPLTFNATSGASA